MANITSSLTILAVEDVDAARDFCTEKLGYEEEFRTGGWSFVARGSLGLRIGHCPGITPMSRCQDHSLIVQAVVDEHIDALFEEFKANGVDVTGPEDKPWGRREFAVATPDGHRFLFSMGL